MNTTKDFMVNENKKDGSHEPQAIKVRNKSNDDIVSYYPVISFIIDFKH